MLNDMAWLNKFRSFFVRFFGLSWRSIWVKSEFTHFHSYAEQIIVAFALCLGFLPCLAPHVDAVSTDQNGCRSRILLHRFVHAVFKILFEWGVFDDWHNQLFVITQIAAQLMIINSLLENEIKNSTFKHSHVQQEVAFLPYLDHFQISAPKFFARPEEGRHHSVRRMRVNNCSGTTLTIWQHKQWSTLALLQSGNETELMRNSDDSGESCV